MCPPPPLSPRFSPRPSSVFLLARLRGHRRGEKRRYVVPEQTRQSIGARQAEGREGAGVIVLQNNLNFNYFGELQKRRCDSLTVCHRKINWLLLLPPSSTTFRAYEPLSLFLSYTHTRCIFLYRVILK